MGDTFFRVHGRVFAFVNRPHRGSVTVKPRPNALKRYGGVPYVRRARYLGVFGWLTVKVRDAASLRAALQLVDESYASAASSPLVGDAAG